MPKDSQSFAAEFSTLLEKPDALIIRPSAFIRRAQRVQHLGEAIQLQ